MGTTIFDAVTPDECPSCARSGELVWSLGHKYDYVLTPEKPFEDMPGLGSDVVPRLVLSCGNCKMILRDVTNLAELTIEMVDG